MKIGKIIKCLPNSVGSITKPHCTQRHRTTQLPAINILVTLLQPLLHFQLSFELEATPAHELTFLGACSLFHTPFTPVQSLLWLPIYIRLLWAAPHPCCWYAWWQVSLIWWWRASGFFLHPRLQTNSHAVTHSPLQVSWRGRCLVTQRKLAWVWGKKNMGQAFRPSPTYTITLNQHFPNLFNKVKRSYTAVPYSSSVLHPSVHAYASTYACRKKKPALQTKYIQAEKQTALGSCCVLPLHTPELPYLPAPWEVKSYIRTNKCNPIKNK